MNCFRVAALVVLAAAVPGWSQEPQGETEDSTDAWRELYVSEAKLLRLFAVRDDDKHPLSLENKPVMRWISFNGFNGDVFVWLKDGRPEVVGNIVAFPADGLKDNQRYTLAELHNLSSGPIEAEPTADGQVWKTPAGVTPIQITDAAPPGKTERERKRQLRALAREFSGQLNHYGEKWNLRMLDKPLLEYGETSPEVLGGALFAFVAFRTDPELLLLIEARAGKDGRQWVYVPARFSQQDLWLKHRDKQVWESLVGPAGDVDPKAADSHYRVYDNKLQTLPTEKNRAAPVGDSPENGR